MEILIQEIKYQLTTISRWAREQKLRMMGVDRSFYCQREFEFKSKCKHQCDHCKEYYKPLNKK